MALTKEFVVMSMVPIYRNGVIKELDLRLNMQIKDDGEILFDKDIVQTAKLNTAEETAFNNFITSLRLERKANRSTGPV